MINNIMRVKIYFFCFLLSWIVLGCTNKTEDKKFWSFRYGSHIPNNRIVLIIPGLGQSTLRSEYQKIGEYYESKGITPIYVEIDWRKAGLNKFAFTAFQIGSEIKRKYPENRIYLFGFSFGAVIAYQLSDFVNPAHTFLCSMSPVFAEDCRYQIFPFRQIIGALNSISFKQTALSSVQQSYFAFIYGEHDSFLINNSIIGHRKLELPCSKTFIVKGGTHNLSNPAYLSFIKNYIEEKL